MPAGTSNNARNRRIIELIGGADVQTNVWSDGGDGYNHYIVEDIYVQPYNSLLLNISTSNSNVSTASGDVSIGMNFNRSTLGATDTKIKAPVGTLSWNLQDRTAAENTQQANFLWTNSQANIISMKNKFGESPFASYIFMDVPTNNTAVLPYLPYYIDLYFRQQLINDPIVISWSLFGIYSE